MRSQEPQFITALFDAGASIYEVGGVVRDRLLQIHNKDSDLLVTQVPMKDLVSLLEKYGKVVPVGRSFGVLKFTPHSSAEIIDIALPRKEVSTGTGHRDFEVDFDPKLPVEIDLGRRDFTINAMARHLRTGKLIDPFGGEKDLRDKMLRMVFTSAFVEDPLRLLRAIQFAARFSLTIEPNTETAIKESATLIKTVSAERVIEEIRKLFLAEKPSVGFKLMLKTDLLQHVFPELHACVGVEQSNKLYNDDVFYHTMRVLDASRNDEAIPFAGDLELMFAALFHDIGKPATKRFTPEKDRVTFYNHQAVSRRMAKVWLKNLKVSTIGVDPKRVATLIENHMFQTKSFFTEKAIRRFIGKIGEDLIFKLVDLRLADNRGGKYPDGIQGVLKLRNRIKKEIESKPALRVKDLAVTGHDIMAMGVAEGPRIGSIQKALMQIVLDDPEKNTKEILTDIIKDQLL